MKVILRALLAGLVVASNARAQTALDRKPGKSSFDEFFVKPKVEAEKKAQREKLEIAEQQNRVASELLRQRLVSLGAQTVSGTVLSVVKPGEQVLILCDHFSAGDAQCYLTGKREMVPGSALPGWLAANVVVLLKTPPEFGRLVDKDRVKVLAGSTGETFQYTTALGAQSTVRVYGTHLKTTP